MSLDKKVKIYNKVSDEVLKEMNFKSFLDMNKQQAIKACSLITSKLKLIKDS
jgi:hypothetical protein